MLLLNCPNCGPRNVSEFRHGGETNPRPSTDAALTESEWAEFLYMRNNISGLQTEWWYHRSGCGLWFLAERNTYTNEVLRTYVWQPTARSESDSAAERAGEPPGDTAAKGPQLGPEV